MFLVLFNIPTSCRIKNRMALDVEDPAVVVPAARNVTFNDEIEDTLIPLTQVKRKYIFIH